MNAALITDTQLKKGLLAYLDACSAKVPAGMQEPLFSVQHDSRMRLILSAGKRRESRRNIRRSAAAVLLVLVLSFSMVMAFSAEARAGFQGWFIKIRKDLIQYEFNHTMDDRAYIICAPGSLPEGFEKAETTIKDNYTLKLYKNDLSGDTIRFEYSNATETMIAEVNRQKASAELLLKDGIIEKYCIQDGNNCRVFWHDPQRRLVFFVDSSLDKSALASCFKTMNFRLPLYEPTWLPEGFEEVDKEMIYPSVDLLYMKSDEMLLFTYYDIAELEGIDIDRLGDSVDYKKMTINQLPAYYFPASKRVFGSDLVIVDEENNLVYIVCAILPEDVLVSIAESIVCSEIEW